jgi:hypothetical protein
MDVMEVSRLGARESQIQIGTGSRRILGGAGAHHPRQEAIAW